MKAPKEFTDTALNIIKRDKNLKAVQAEYERMSRLQYNLPEPLQRWEWIRSVISTAPYDALRGATRALSNLESALNIHPITVIKAIDADDESLAAQRLANEWETNLLWQMGRAESRLRSFASDVVWSVGLYDECIAKIIHLPTQFKAAPLSEAEMEAYLMVGDWALEIVDVKTVYPTYSRYGLQSMLSVNRRTARWMVNNYGEKAEFVIEQSRKDKQDLDDPQNTWIEFEYGDHENKLIWANSGNDITNTAGEIILPPQPWLKINDGDSQVPFLPWVAAAGGTSVDAAPEFQRKPILFPVLQAELWATANISETLMMAQQLATASSTTDVFSGPSSEDIEENWEEPRRRINLTAVQEYQQIQDAGMDSGIREVFDRLEAAIQRATVADVLVTAQPISGEQAFASYNLQVQQALASLGDVKDTSQRFFVDFFKKMLLITHYTGSEISGYGDGLEKYTIDSEDINPEAIYLSVELKADVPADRVQRVTAGQVLVREIGYSQEDAMRFLGETDPQGVMKRADRERLRAADLQARIEAQQRKISGQYQEDVMAAAQALVQQQIAQQQAQGQQQQAQPAGAAPAERPVRGQAFNPAQGGTPPVVANPEASNGTGEL